MNKDFTLFRMFMAGSTAAPQDLLPFLVLLIVVSCTGVRDDASSSVRTASDDAFTFPPEWEAHEAMWIDWTDFALETRLDMIDAFHKTVPVKLLTFSDSMESLAWKMMKERNIDTSRVKVYFHPIPNYFLRDAGPKYLTDGKSYRMADFGWDCFGGADFDSLCLRRGEIDNDLAAGFGIPVSTTDVRVEGGALEVSTNEILAFKEMALERNPARTLQELERVYLQVYGKKKMIWIDKRLLLEKPGRKVGNYYGQGANGHIDDYMRFVNDSTILVGIMLQQDRHNNPINQIDYDRLQQNLKQIKAARNSEGKLYRIIEVPMPDVTPYIRRRLVTQKHKENHPDFYEEANVGDSIHYVPVMSYLNFTISNGVVLIHKYWHEGIPETERQKDQLFYTLMTQLFPDRKIVQIDALPLNWNGGGIHCATQQVPRLVAVRW